MLRLSYTSHYQDFPEFRLYKWDLLSYQRNRAMHRFQLLVEIVYSATDANINLCPSIVVNNIYLLH